ncbi:uncharacterized protein J4E78_009516 [Alternaria triticimaculans]|uniref:uncharacterized protein n=1 Tax=Alternaria triticimaculans TaxID=297637 RepID=UPI0020C4FDB8|nr:uncharacterized protein J4E78_009516 [Alternaria triticimaculans]KAI4644697.1 hypothetical protein J4E78_009516 [Alternaria triticimaculans]
MTHKRRHEFNFNKKNRKRSNSIKDADCDAKINLNKPEQHPDHFKKRGTLTDHDDDSYDDQYLPEDIDSIYPDDDNTLLYDSNGDCYHYEAVMPSSNTADLDTHPVPIETQHVLSTKTAAEVIEVKLEEEIETLEIRHSASWIEGKEQAKGTCNIVSLQSPPWTTDLPAKRPYHGYGITPGGLPRHGRLSPWLYLCDHTCDLGLCDITFRLPHTCPLGSGCRWRHEILWDELSFLITSGRLTLRRARVMLANWQSSASLDDDVDAWHRMNAIIDRLQYLEAPAILRYTYPYLFPVRDSHALFERLSD